MIQFSTPELSQVFPENTVEETPSILNKEDEKFYTSIKNELNKEVKQPHASTIENILAHSRKVSE